MTNTTISAAAAGTVTFGDITVNRLGLGTNRILDDDAGHTLLKSAVALGVNFIDTAHCYTEGVSERAIGHALTPYPHGLVIATKGGVGTGAEGSGPLGSPEQLRGHLEQSLESLHVNSIDLYQLHRVDPTVNFLETMNTLRDFQEEGLITHIGLSEVSLEQLQQAQEIAPIVSIQNEYNVAIRKHEALVDYCTDQGIVFIPWFPLGGLRGDTVKVSALVNAIAKKYEATDQQIALAWLLQRSNIILPIPGTLSIEHLEKNLKAAAIKLNDKDYDLLTMIDRSANDY